VKAQILMPQEREELRMIARLQTMNVYPQLVRKLTEGQSAAGVGRWAMKQRVEGAPGAWGLGMWLRHTQALRRHVVAAKERLSYEEHRRRLTVAPVRPDPDAVLAKVDAMVEDKSLMDFIPKEAQQVLKHVMGEEKEIRAIHALQIAAIAYRRAFTPKRDIANTNKDEPAAQSSYHQGNNGERGLANKAHALDTEVFRGEHEGRFHLTIYNLTKARLSRPLEHVDSSAHS